MNKVEKLLYRTRRTLGDVCDELDVDIENVSLNHIAQCSSCSQWLKFKQLELDSDKNPVCDICRMTYGD